MCGKYVSFILSPSSFMETIVERSRLSQLPTDGKSTVGGGFSSEWSSFSNLNEKASSGN